MVRELETRAPLGGFATTLLTYSIALTFNHTRKEIRRSFLLLLFPCSSVSSVDKFCIFMAENATASNLRYFLTSPGCQGREVL